MPGPAYRIHTPRLVVRCWEPADAQKLHDAIVTSIPHLRAWLPWVAAEPIALDARIEILRRFRGQFDLGTDFVYGIFDPDEDRVLGGLGLHTRVRPEAREIGYWIRSDAAGQGYATESTAALTRVAFEVDEMKRVHIHCDPANAASAAIPRKLGYTHEATLRRRGWGVDCQPRDTMIWTLLADEYPDTLGTRAELQAFDVVGRRLL